jgi:hypothetical protein
VDAPVAAIATIDMCTRTHEERITEVYEGFNAGQGAALTCLLSEVLKIWPRVRLNTSRI